MRGILYRHWENVQVNQLWWYLVILKLQTVVSQWWWVKGCGVWMTLFRKLRHMRMMLIHKLWHLYDADSQAVAIVWCWYCTELQTVVSQLWWLKDCGKWMTLFCKLRLGMMLMHKMWYVNDADSQAFVFEWCWFTRFGMWISIVD